MHADIITSYVKASYPTEILAGTFVITNQNVSLRMSTYRSTCIILLISLRIISVRVIISIHLIHPKFVMSLH